MPTKPPTWFWLVPLLSCGILAPVVPFVIALRKGTAQAWAWFAGLCGMTLLGFALVGSQPSEADNAVTNMGGTLILLGLIASLGYGGAVGRGVLWSPAPPLAFASMPTFPPPAPGTNAAAVAAVNAAREKRSAALEIVGSDPQMARDLRIGRPDLPRTYDDGGLVDLNSAPATVLTSVLGLSETDAAHVVEVRQSLGKFQLPEDLMHLAGMEPATYDQVRDRLILL